MNLLLSLFLLTQLAPPYKTRIFLDADARFLIYARYYDNELIAIDSIKSIYDYFDKGLMARNRDLLLQELKRDLVQQGGYASKGLFGTFEIALPKGGFSDFMGETGKLDVGGYVKITLGGSETFISNLPGESRPSLLPELEMKQEMAINLDGQVGDRMRVFIDHNSERLSETQNKITVTYKGREDEIIQEIEGGDTQLSIPATTYTGDIPSHRGLFGIKSTAKFGPLDLVAIASKEQTQTQEIEIEGSTQAQYDTIWAKEWERRRFFNLGTYDRIIDLEVYVDDNIAQNNTIGITYYGEAFLDINDDNFPDDTANGTNYREGYFTLTRDPSDYRFIPGDNIIELNYALPTYYVLGVWYKKIDISGDTVEVGRVYENDTTRRDTIQLKLICPEQRDTSSYTYNYERKNYYQIVSPGSRLDSLRIYILESGGEHKDRQDDVPFIELLGLDKSPRDGLIDDNTAFLSGQGLLKFPMDQPFADTVLHDPDSSIYTDPYKVDKGKYYIYKKTTEARPTYTLPENVEQVWVYVDDVLQDSLVDYHVDYDERKIEFRKPILPTSKIRIKVEYAPFFSAAEKSLVGLRGSLRPFGDASLGSSFFYRTESYPAEHIRLREEPFNRMIWEVDFNYPQALPIMTKLVDWLPLVATEAESRMTLNFEGAYSFSDLNAKGEVFLDDLESATIISNDFSITKNSWVLSSLPVGMDTAHFVSQRLIWFNPRDQERLQADDIYVDPQDPNEIADVLKIIFIPDDTLSFGGLTQYIYGENFDEIENLELIIKGKGGRIHIDFAQELNEDQLRRNKNGELVGRGLLNDEDKNKNGVWTQQDEDTGLDSLFGDDDADITGDDGNDDYQQDDYTGGINGTEFNKLWDTEDIDRNGVLNSEDRYFSYSIDMDDTTRFLVANAGLQDDWKMFRVSIKDSLLSDTVVGQPDWRDIKYVRIWLDHFTDTETLLVYSLSATGSRWKNYGIVGYKQPPAPSEIFTLTPVNTKTHAYYLPPYPLEKDEFGQLKTEGGLEFRLDSIQQGHTCVAHRQTDDNEDYRAYDTLTFYLNARNGDISKPLISIRIGSDSLNYYEYTAEYEDGDIGYNGYRLFQVSMRNFLELKQERSNSQDTLGDSIYTVVGNPSLSKNQFFEVRITNQFVTLMTDTIWFNDVKLTSPKTEVGRIFRGNGSVNLADLVRLSFAYDESNGRFKRLSESKDISTQSAGRGYSVSSNIALDKFLPKGWGFMIPFGWNYRKTIAEPRFSYFADDIEITDEEQEEHKSRSVMKSYALAVSKMISRNWLLKHTVDRLSFNYDRSESYGRRALSADTSVLSNYRASYTLDPRFDVKILRQIFRPLPTYISFSAGYTDNKVSQYYRISADSAFKPSEFGVQRRRTLNPSFSIRYSPHSIVSATYNFSQSRDSVSTTRRFGEEVGRTQSLNTSLARDLKIISPRFIFNSSYNEDYRFEIRQEQDLRNVSNSGTYGVETDVDIKPIFNLFTRLRDETKDSLAAAGSPAWFAKQIEQIIGYLQNPSLSYTRQRSSNYLNVKVRPDMKYQWGIIDSIPVEDVAAGSYPGRGITDTYWAKSGLNFRIFNVTGEYNGGVNRTFSYGGNEVRTQTVKYPNLIVKILRFESLPLLKKWARSSTIETRFNQSFEKRYDVIGDSMDLISDSKGFHFDPLVNWQTMWNKGISTNIGINYSETNANDYAGPTKVPSRFLNRGVSASLAYTFSAPRGLGLPFLKGIKFRSNLSLSLGATYNRNSSYYTNLDQPTNDSSTLTTNIGLSYSFSSSITGGANIDYTQNKDMNSNQDSRSIGLNIWTNINF